MVRDRELQCYRGRLREALDHGTRPPRTLVWIEADGVKVRLNGTFGQLLRVGPKPELAPETVAEYAWLVSRYAGDGLGPYRVTEEIDEALFRATPENAARERVAELLHPAEVSLTEGGFRVRVAATRAGGLSQVEIDIDPQGRVGLHRVSPLLEESSVCAARVLR